MRERFYQTVDGKRYFNAINTAKPVFVFVKVRGMSKLQVFEDVMAKNFYIKCLNNSAGDAPVDVIAYNITDNGGNFLVASYDQAAESTKRFFDTVKTKYIDYCKEVFDFNSNPFKATRYKIFEYKDDALTGLLAVHKYSDRYSLPRDHEFSSFKVFASGKLDDLHYFKKAFDVEFTLASFLQIHQSSLSTKKMLTMEKSNLKKIVEASLLRYGVGFKPRNPEKAYVMAIFDIISNSDFSFDEICNAIHMSKKIRYNLLGDLIAELMMKMHMDYFQIKNDLKVDDIILFNAITKAIEIIKNFAGYSYPYIATMLGNMNTVVSDFMAAGIELDLIVNNFKLEQHGEMNI